MTAGEVERSPLSTTFRVLTFRASGEELERLDNRHLALGVLFTWLAGMGRYWDNPRAVWAQHLGIGSLVYILVLAAFLWFFLGPISPKKLDYKRMLTFVSMTSLPAVIYAIPVERFMPMGAAQLANMWFLAVVATWRLALLFWFMHRALRIGPIMTIVAGLLPMSMIIGGLAILNLEHVVFQLMGGLAPEDESPNDGAYLVVVALTYFSIFAFVPLALIYLVGLGRIRNSAD